MKLEVLSGLAGIDPEEWDDLLGDGPAFLEWGWLASLEESGCVRAETGWLPQHLVLRSRGKLMAACPVYVKGHSLGEFVFDHGWAEAAERAGIAYYPKLLVASPFTPATGSRFLTRPGADRRALVRALGQALRELCTTNGFSSVHVNFCLPDEVEALESVGFECRAGYQFQWINPGWRTFDDFLAAFRSKRRVQIRRERRELEAQGIDISVHEGAEIPDDLFPVMFRLYKSTTDKLYWGRQYLNSRLFEFLRRRWKHRLSFVVARRGGEVVAGTFNVRKGDVLYGRYWGTFEEIRFLHFNVCYYAAIEHCLREGIRRFEPGAGGEFKHLRGFDARRTESMHFLADTRLARAVRDYLAREREAVDRRIAFMDEQSELRR
ncbi:MAG: GNAT family N-acetyltransferase [Candidatus Binatia bacterium]